MKALKDIYSLKDECSEAKDEKKKECNEKSIKIMLDYHILDKETAKKLAQDGKIPIDNIDEIIKGDNNG